jgi:aquaporin Z
MKQYLVEFAGTLAFVFVVLWTGDPLAIGAMFGSLMYVFGKQSVVAFNPAVSIALYFNKKLSLKDSLLYVVLEIAAGIAAFLLYKLK